jgi:Transglutaminase-like superfamily
MRLPGRYTFRRMRPFNRRTAAEDQIAGKAHMLRSQLRTRTMSIALLASLSALMLPSLAKTVAAADESPQKIEKEESWQVIYLAGQRIGFAHFRTEPISRDGKAVVRTVADTSMTMKRFGQPLVVKQAIVTEETLDGNLLRFSYEMANPPAKPTSTVGKVEGTELRLDQTVNGETKQSVQAWQPDVKSPTFHDRALRASPLKPGETRAIEAFMPEFNKVSTITITALDFEETLLLQGKKQKLLKMRITQSIVPGLVETAYIDATGDTIKTSINMLGAEMVTYQVTQDEALKAIKGAELDLAVGTLIKVKKIPNAHASKKIVYRITTPEQNPEDVIPTGGTQTVRKSGDDTAELTVTALAIPDKAAIRPTEEQFLASSQYLQRDDENVQSHARKAAGDATDSAQIARRMEKYVYDNLTKKNFSTAMASAGEVARKMEGDCTEHAVLLAAMLRVKGIPSRVAVGLVYADSLSAFGGHMWTEAYLDGRWFPLDATLGRGGIGAAHIKLSDSSLSDDGPSALSNFAPLMLVIGRLKIDILSVE